MEADGRHYEELLERDGRGGGGAWSESGDAGRARAGAGAEGWNRTEGEYGAGSVHELFEEQVREEPGAVAVVHEGKRD